MTTAETIKIQEHDIVNRLTAEDVLSNEYFGCIFIEFLLYGKF